MLLDIQPASMSLILISLSSVLSLVMSVGQIRELD